MNSALAFPSYRHRYLPGWTLEKIRALPDKALVPVIVAVGAIEQHGPHLPVAVDSFLGQAWLTRIFAALPDFVPALAGPPVTVGKSNEHTGFPGTLIVSRDTLRLQVLAIARQLHAWGFRSLLVLNTHGGNTAVLTCTLREIEAGYEGMKAGFLTSGVRPDISAQEAAYGFHAAEVESSLLYALAPQYCRPEAAPCHYPARLEDPGRLRPEAAPATYAWASQDIAPLGVMGDATAATAEKGARWLDAITAGYVRRLTAHAAALRSP
ncbi:uncharacterized protein, putative amidase [Opitutaceae bacterium TAV1]|nr:uncharacterized protein, putative amidase [Opitutaceae bacterium TAV1]